MYFEVNNVKATMYESTRFFKQLPRNSGQLTIVYTRMYRNLPGKRPFLCKCPPPFFDDPIVHVLYVRIVRTCSFILPL